MTMIGTRFTVWPSISSLISLVNFEILFVSLFIMTNILKWQNWGRSYPTEELDQPFGKVQRAFFQRIRVYIFCIPYCFHRGFSSFQITDEPLSAHTIPAWCKHPSVYLNDTIPANIRGTEVKSVQCIQVSTSNIFWTWQSHCFLDMKQASGKVHLPERIAIHHNLQFRCHPYKVPFRHL